jgi:uncharacterized protein YxeA
VISVKKAIAIIVSLIFVLCVAGLSFAAEKMDKKEAPMKEEKTMKKAHSMAKRMVGSVTAVDEQAKTITVKNKKGEKTITCEDNTKVHMGKAKKSCADVKAGDKVYVTYSEIEGKDVAKTVSIHAAKAEKKMGKKKMMMEKKAEPAPATPETK